MSLHTFVGPYGSTLRFNRNKSRKGRWVAESAFANTKISVAPATRNDGTDVFDVEVECEAIEPMHPYAARELAEDIAKSVDEAGLFAEIIGTVDMTVGVSWVGPEGPDDAIFVTNDNRVEVPGVSRPLTPEEVREYAANLEEAAVHADAVERRDTDHFIAEAQSFIDQWDPSACDCE